MRPSPRLQMWCHVSETAEEHATPPEQDLAYAVLTRAVLDALSTSRRGATAKSFRIIVGDARSFCMDHTGAWRRAREFWCSLAGIDPDALRERVSAMLSATPAVRQKVCKTLLGRENTAELMAAE